MSAAFDPVATALPDGPLLIESSAGTGKTWTITFVVLRLILERGLPLERILVVTFTNAATDELVGRVRGRLREAVAAWEDAAVDGADPTLLAYRSTRAGAGCLEEDLRRLRRALRDFDRNAISTIHGFCARVLSSFAFEFGVDFDHGDPADDTALLDRAARDVWRRRVTTDRRLAALSLGIGLGELERATELRQREDEPDRILPELGDLDEERQVLVAAEDAVRHAWDRDGLVAQAASIPEDNRVEGFAEALAAWVGAMDAWCADGEACEPPDPAALPKLVKGKGSKSLKEAVAAWPAVASLVPLAGARERFGFAWREAFQREAIRRYRELKERVGALGFDDLLRRVREALDARPALAAAVRERYAAALIDEFQDTDAVQYAIFRRLFGEAPCFLIGDPKQAIYRFRGADIHTYLAAKVDAGEACYHLPRNYRSGPGCIAAVNAVFARQPQAFLHDAIPFTPVAPGREDGDQLVGDDRGALHWWLPAERIGRKEDADPLFVAATVAEIGHLLSGTVRYRSGDGAERPLTPRDIAVLVDSNDKARTVHAALLESGISAVVRQAGNVLAAEEAEELARLLAALASPRDGRVVRAACATGLWGETAAAIASWGATAGGAGWLAVQERFTTARETWLGRGLLAALKPLLAERRVAARLLDRPDGERRLTDLRHLLELLCRQDLELGRHPAALVGWLQAARRDPAGIDEDERRLRLEREDDAVQVVTMHSAKGLQWTVVFCPFLWGSSRPWWNTVNRDDQAFRVHGGNCPVPLAVRDAAGRRVFDYGRTHLEEAVHEQLAERVRLAYVALTRARERCYVAWGNIGSRPELSPLAWLLHGPQDDTIGEDFLELVRSFTLALDKKSWDAAALGADLATEAHTTWSEPPVRPEQPPVPAGAAPAPAARRARTFLGGIGDPARRAAAVAERLGSWRIDSYTSVTRDAHGAAPESPLTLDEPGEGPETGAPVEDPLAAFPRGPLPGTFLHAVIEGADFADRGTWPGAIATAAARHGFLDDAGNCPWAETLTEMLARLGGAAVPGWGFSLGEVARGDRRDEWRFLVPLAGGGRGGGPRPADLAAVFAAGDHPLPAAYVASLAQLPRRILRGYLTGSIDCVLRHGGRWYLLDWKSNHLGAADRDYTGEAVLRAMCEHHYVVQYHLYAAALRRFLRHRLGDGYDHEDQFGGVAYAFLRGLRPGADTGWYVDRPSAALLDRLDALLAGGGTA